MSGRFVFLRTTIRPTFGPYFYVSVPGRVGGGTDSLTPFFGAPVLLPPNLKPPLFMDAQGQLLEINIE